MLSSTSRILEAVAYAKKHPGVSRRRIGRDFGVDNNTLSRRLAGTQKLRQEAHRHQQLLTKGDEKAIANLCREMDDIGFPVTFDIVREMAQNILNERGEIHQVGEHWVDRFIKRNPEVKSCYVKQMDKSRQQSAANKGLSTQFYILLRRLSHPQPTINPPTDYTCQTQTYGN